MTTTTVATDIPSLLYTYSTKLSTWANVSPDELPMYKHGANSAVFNIRNGRIMYIVDMVEMDEEENWYHDGFAIIEAKLSRADEEGMISLTFDEKSIEKGRVTAEEAGKYIAQFEA